MINMQVHDTIYKIKTATEEDIFLHLKECDNNFTPSLSSRLDIAAYSKKIFDKSITFEAWQNSILSGTIAAYFNKTTKSAFITNVSVLKKIMGLGIASKLLKMCIDYSFKNEIKQITLEVNKNNIHAIAFYKRFNFTEDHVKGDELVMNYFV